ncbi:MAG TPA: 50S ribosomal protein L25 [Acidimicrobiia bacterium]|nr:50S ribosomal protein L25 [Acidimicrobiia bacterium]
MSQVTLRAHAGRKPGSAESRRIRRKGLTPAVVYGPGLDPMPLSVDSHDLHVALHTDAGTNAIISLEIEGGETLTTMARVIDKHPFRNEYRHIDFVRVDLTRTVSLEVAIHFEGEPVGVSEGGVFSPARTHALVEVLPTAIPQYIELDISGVEVGGALRISDLPPIEGVTYLEDPDAVVMSITAPAAEIEEPAAEEGEEDETAEEEQTDDEAAASGEAATEEDEAG